MSNGQQFQIPDTYWRVSLKALVYDTHNRLLVFMDHNTTWEMPGGGWEHAESFAECISRELSEEAGLQVLAVNEKAVFVYASTTIHGRPKLSVAVRVDVDGDPKISGNDDLVEARFVSREEFLQLPFQPGEAAIQKYADRIWP